MTICASKVSKISFGTKNTEFLRKSASRKILSRDGRHHQGRKKPNTFLRGMSLRTKGVIRKHLTNRVNIVPQTGQNQNNHAKIKVMLTVFFDYHVLCKMCCFHWAKLSSTRNIIWVLRVVYVKRYTRRGRIFKYMHQDSASHTRHWLFVSFSPNSPLTSLRNRLLHLIWLLATFGYFPKWKNGRTDPAFGRAF